MLTFASMLKGQLKTLDAFAPYGTFHIALAYTLNWWFNNKVIPIQTSITTGTIVVGTTVIPFTCTVRPIAASTFNFNPLLLKTAMTGPTAFENLFDYIGKTITATLSMWTANPELDETGTSKMPGVLSTFPVTFYTNHFRAIGTKHKLEVAAMNPVDEDIFYLIWNNFENNLKLAINQINPVISMVSGMAPITYVMYSQTPPQGLYNGQATVKLIAP